MCEKIKLNKKIKFPETLASWMYRDPEEIVDRLLGKSEKEERKSSIERRNKHRRIAALTRKAMTHA